MPAKIGWITSIAQRQCGNRDGRERQQRSGECDSRETRKTRPSGDETSASQPSAARPRAEAKKETGQE